MSDEKGTAETLAETPVNDGIIDLDAAVAEPEVNEDENEGSEKPEAKAEEAKPEAEEEKKKLSGAQRHKLREQRLISELAERDRQIEELRSKAPGEKSSDAAGAPKEEDFNGDYFAWQRALTAFEAGKAASEAIAKQFKTREDSERVQKQSEVARERAVAHAERVEDAREVITDFDEVMGEMKGVNVRQDLIDEIMSSDKSALLAYHLAKNPDKLHAMNSMSPRELAREMGRLEATVQLPTAKKQTSAPPPLTAVKGGASPSSAEGDLSAWLKKTYGK